MRHHRHASLLLLVAACGGGSTDEPEPVTVQVTVENVAERGTLLSSTTDEARDILVSPGVWVAHASGERMFDDGESATAGLQALAEMGDGRELLQELVARDAVVALGVFPVEASGMTYDDAPLEPGDAATFEVSAMSNDRLSFTSMFIHSNDVLVATPQAGIELDLAADETVDISGVVELWDAGTERNEEPGFGPSQPMQGSGGDPEGGVVHRIEGTDAAGWSYPSPATFLRVTMRRR